MELAGVVADVTATVDDRFPAATMTTDLPERLLFRCDDRFDRAVENLVENAVIHNDGDPRVSVPVRKNGDRATIRVADTGPGIPESDRSVLTDQREITHLSHGSGLGLLLVKWIVEGQGGRIDFGDSDLGGTAE